MTSTTNDSTTNSNAALALAVIHAEEDHSSNNDHSNSSVQTAEHAEGILLMQSPHKLQSSELYSQSPHMQSPDTIEQELLASLAMLNRNNKQVVATGTRNTTSHKDAQESLLVSTLQRMDSDDLTEILGITDAGGVSKNKTTKESKLRAKKGESVRAAKKKDENRAKHGDEEGTESPPLQTKSSLGAKLEQDAAALLKKNEKEDADEDQTVLTLWDMKEMFQKEHPQKELPTDEALKQRYKKKASSNHKKKHRTGSRHKTKSKASSRHSYHRSGSSQHSHTTSSSPAMVTKGSVQTLLSMEKWGHGSLDNITMSSSHHKHSRKKYGTSARNHTRRVPHSAPGRGHNSLTDHLNQQQRSPLKNPSGHVVVSKDSNNNTDDGHNSSSSMSFADIMPPIPFQDDDDDDGEVEEFAGDESHNELRAPSLHTPMESPKPASPQDTTTMTASPTVTTTTTPTTPPSSWTHGGDTKIQSDQHATHPASAPATNKKKTTSAAFFKTKLRALLKGNNNDGSGSSSDNKQPLTLLEDESAEMTKTTTADASPNDGGPVKAIRRTLSKNKKSPPGSKSRVGSVFLSNVLGRKSGEAAFGELDCPSSDDDDNIVGAMDSNKDTEHVDVTVALGSSLQGMHLDHHDDDESAQDQERAKMQQEQEKIMRQVEEARIATRRIRTSQRRKRNSRSPSRLIGSDHVPSKSIRDPIKPTSNHSGRSERSKSVDSLTRLNSRRDKTSRTDHEILRKASQNSRSERRRARSIDASKHRKNEGRRRSRSIDESKQFQEEAAAKPSERHGRRRSRSFDAEAARNEDESKEKIRKATRKAYRHATIKPSSASPAQRRRAKAGSKKKAASTPNIHSSPYQTSASKLRRPSGYGDGTAMDPPLVVSNKHDHHHSPHPKISSGGGIRHRREATQVLKERQKQHHIPLENDHGPLHQEPPSTQDEPKPVRRLTSMEPPRSPTPTGEATQEFKLEDWVSSDESDSGEAFSVDAGNGI